MATGQKISAQTAATALGAADLLTIVQSGNNRSIVPTAVTQMAKAWVNFNGTSTVAIRDSYNVSSITDNGTGDYDINFATNFTDANYSACACGSISGTSTPVIIEGTTARTVSAFNANTTNISGTPTDSTVVSYAFFGS